MMQNQLNEVFMENLDNLLELIKNGQISIREASRQSGFTRDYLRKRL